MSTFRMSVRALMRAMVLVGILMVSPTLYGDEGMWTFDKLPTDRLAADHGFRPQPEWIANLRSAAVRFNNGGSGSFVSPDGLIVTNHHVGSDILQKLSTPERNIFEQGFLATNRDQELQAPDLELNVLVDILDVTERIQGAVQEIGEPAEAAEVRRRTIAEIESESYRRTGLRSNVVTLYRGGRYALYTFKKYTDVRLVMAPEFQAAFFGGDPDNFEYPRYCFDVCFFRAYEDGRPAQVEHYLPWNPSGTAEGDLIFVAGNPGRTSRLNTLAHLEYLRDDYFPFLLEFLEDELTFLEQWSALDVERARQAKEDVLIIANSLKARRGGLNGLRDPDFLQRKRAAEDAVRERIGADPALSGRYSDAWDRIAASRDAARDLIKPYFFLERGYAFDTNIFRYARQLVRLADEVSKPNAERLLEYTDASRESLEFQLLSEAPIYRDYETAKLTHALERWRAHDPEGFALIDDLVGDRSLETFARDAIASTKLFDVASRRGLLQASPETIRRAAEDGDLILQLALTVDARAREIRKAWEQTVIGIEESSYARIAEALFELEGESTYPDATFSLRLSYGTVRGYDEGSRTIAPYTNLGGTFARAEEKGSQAPWQLPDSWLEARRQGRIDESVPYNFVSTADIIGGNSGSPVVDRSGRFVGIIFDGNIHSLILDFGYDESLARAIAVDVRAMIEVLGTVYRADALLEELGQPVATSPNP